MMEAASLKKVNMGYLLANILIPIAVILVVSIGSVFLFGDGGIALGTIAFVGAIFWWVFLGKTVYEWGKKKKLEELDASGFIRNHTFNGDGCTVAIDLNTNKIAILFRWNPSEIFIRPASALSRVHTEDGKTGIGITAGSARVRFVFYVEGMRVNVNTFTSNRRWAMDSEYIRTGISKADMMVEALVAAGAKAGA